MFASDPKKPDPAAVAGPVKHPGSSGSGAAPAKASYTQPFNALGILKALRRRWLAAALLGLLAAGAVFAAVWYFLPPPQYCAAAKFLIPSHPDSTLYEHPEAKAEFGAFEDTQVATIKSQMVLNAALRKTQSAHLAGIPKRVDPVEWLEKEVHIDFPNGREILRLSIYSDDQETCKALVAALAAAYLEELTNETDKRRQVRLDELKALTDQYEAKVKRLRQALHDRAKPVGGGNDLALALKQLEAHEQAVEARHKLIDVEGRIRDLETQETVAKGRGPADVEISPEALDAFIDKRPEIVALVGQKAALDAQAEVMKPNAVGGENHPEVKKLIGQAQEVGKKLETQRAALRAECEKLMRDQAAAAENAKATQLHAEVELARATRTRLVDDIQRLSKDAQDFNEAAGDLEELKPELTEAEAVSTHSAQEMEKLLIEKHDPLRVTPWEGVVVTRPDELDRKIKTAAMGAGGGFLLMLVLVGFLEFRARRVCAPQEVVEGLGLKLVGTVPARPSYRRAARNGHWHALLTESVDSSRTMLLHATGSEAVRVVLITSAVGGEAKTSLAGHLAVSLARSGRKTLLIDGDLRNPAIHRLFDLRPGPGFSELLRAEAALPDVLCPTAVPGLHVMTAGICNLESLSRLSRDGVEALLAGLKETYDFIILDSSPILPVTDALLLARHADGVLFSILQNVSTLPAVCEAYNRLVALGAVPLGSVVSGTRPNVALYGRGRYGPVMTADR